MTYMRKIAKYKKVQGSKKQKEKLIMLNKFQDEIASYYYDNKYNYKKNKK